MERRAFVYCFLSNLIQTEMNVLVNLICFLNFVHSDEDFKNGVSIFSHDANYKNEIKTKVGEDNIHRLQILCNAGHPCKYGDEFIIRNNTTYGLESATRSTSKIPTLLSYARDKSKTLELPKTNQTHAEQVTFREISHLFIIFIFKLYLYI